MNNILLISLVVALVVSLAAASLKPHHTTPLNLGLVDEKFNIIRSVTDEDLARIAQLPPFTREQRAQFAKNMALKAFYHNVCEKVVALGYPCENHYVTTEDGFVLNVIHIPSRKPNAHPVLLQHGLVDSAVTWVANAYGFQNLACVLHDAGHDVWMPNARGNQYSMNNTKYSPHDEEYWRRIDFDWMARYDLPACVDYILSHNTAKQVTYIGHSQGCAMGFAAFSTLRPEYAAKVDTFVALAPACAIGHTTSLFMRIASDYDFATIAALMGIKEVMQADPILHLAMEMCPNMGDVCAGLIDILCGPGSAANLNSTNLPTITFYDPAGTSVSNLIHWAQQVRSGNFQMHDYGAAQNMIYYNQTEAPMYTVSKMTGPPTIVYYGEDDSLADPTDVTDLIAQIPQNVSVYTEMVSGYAHLDFVWGLDAYTVLYRKILKQLPQP